MGRRSFSFQVNIRSPTYGQKTTHQIHWRETSFSEIMFYIRSNRSPHLRPCLKNWGRWKPALDRQFRTEEEAKGDFAYWSKVDRSEVFKNLFFRISGRSWRTGVFYDLSATEIDWSPPAPLFALKHADMKVGEVRKIQRPLVKRGIDPGRIDGIYGPKTSAAVAAFQPTEDLIVDGKVGPQTAQALNFSL